jgi:molybdenum cofactor cytidylyltransferase
MALTVGALVLAAGRGSRFGGAKLAADLGGEAVIARTLAAVRATGLPAMVVTGGHAEAVRAAVGDAATVHAPEFETGLSASLRAGLGAAPAEWDAVLVCLGDMPWVRPETLGSLAAALGSADAAYPVHGGRRGNPAGFRRSLWPRLMALEGDRGAGGLLKRVGAAAVVVDDPGVLRDVDVPGDLKGSDDLSGSGDLS